jgi:hypothetical protein
MQIKTITIIDGDTSINESSIDLDGIDMDENPMIKVIRIDEGALKAKEYELQALEELYVDLESDIREGKEMILKIRLEGLEECDTARQHHKKIIIKSMGDPGSAEFQHPMPGAHMKMIEIDSLGSGHKMISIDGNLSLDIDSILRANGIEPDSAHGKHKLMIMDAEGMHPEMFDNYGGDPHRVIVRKKLEGEEAELRLKQAEYELRRIEMKMEIDDEDAFFSIKPIPLSKGLVISAPGEGKFTLVLENEGGDILQKTVSKISEGQFNSFISLKDLDSGTYFVSLRHGDKSAKKKLVIH